MKYQISLVNIYLLSSICMPERLCYSHWFSTRSNFASHGTLDHVWTHFSLTHELWMGEFATGLYRGETGDAGEVINHWVQLLKRNTIFLSWNLDKKKRLCFLFGCCGHFQKHSYQGKCLRLCLIKFVNIN